MSGSCEAFIKSIKHALKSTVLDLYLLAKCCQWSYANRILANQGPITHISEDIDDFSCVTLKHFLIHETNKYSSPEVK